MLRVYGTSLYPAALRMIRNALDIEDLVPETFGGLGERAALVRAYAALFAAVHREER